jgi:hypothetical protein
MPELRAGERTATGRSTWAVLLTLLVAASAFPDIRQSEESEE